MKSQTTFTSWVKALSKTTNASRLLQRFGVVVGVLFLSAYAAQAAVLVSIPFNYTNAANLPLSVANLSTTDSNLVGTVGLSGNFAANFNATLTNSAPLSYTVSDSGGTIAAGTSGLLLDKSKGLRSSVAYASALTGKDLYVRFLYNPSDINDRLILSVGNSGTVAAAGTSAPRFDLGGTIASGNSSWVVSGFNAAGSGQTTSPALTNNALNTTYLVVGCLHWNGAGYGSMDLWVNPTYNNGTPPGGNVTAGTPTGTLFSSLSSPCFRFDLGTSTFAKLSSFVIGETWSDVVPGYPPVVATTNVWNQTVAGTYNWNTAANWLPSVNFPNSVGSIAIFSNNIAGAQTVNLNQAITNGVLNIYSAQSVAINAGTSGSLLLSNGLAAASITVTNGSHTIGAPVTLAGPGVNVALSSGTELALNGAVSGAGKITLSGSGALTIGTTSTYSGNTILNGGTLTLTGSILNSPAVNLGGGTLLLPNGGTDKIGNSVPVALAGGGITLSGTVSETVGVLSISGSGDIDFGSGAATLKFANSSAATWGSSVILVIKNWSGDANLGGGTDQLFFGTDSSGLTGGQLGKIYFANPAGFSSGTYAATILSTGEVVPTGGSLGDNIWAGVGADNNVNTPANWLTGSNPAFDGTQSATIGLGGSLAIINTNVAFNGITFNRDADFSLLNTSTNSLTIGSGGISAQNPGTTVRNYSVSAPINLNGGGSQTWTALPYYGIPNTRCQLNIAGNISGSDVINFIGDEANVSQLYVSGNNTNFSGGFKMNPNTYFRYLSANANGLGTGPFTFGDSGGTGVEYLFFDTAPASGFLTISNDFVLNRSAAQSENYIGGSGGFNGNTVITFAGKFTTGPACIPSSRLNLIPTAVNSEATYVLTGDWSGYGTNFPSASTNTVYAVRGVPGTTIIGSQNAIAPSSSSVTVQYVVTYTGTNLLSGTNVAVPLSGKLILGGAFTISNAVTVYENPNVGGTNFNFNSLGARHASGTATYAGQISGPAAGSSGINFFSQNSNAIVQSTAPWGFFDTNVLLRINAPYDYQNGTNVSMQIPVGTVVLAANSSGSNGITGPVTVNNGTLLLNGILGNGGSSNVVTVLTNATFGGTGTNLAATAFNDGSRAKFTIGAPLSFVGAATIGSGVVVHLTSPTGVPGGSYVVATFDTNGVTGAFSANAVDDSGSLSNGTAVVTTTTTNVIVTVTPPTTTTTTVTSSLNPSLVGSNVTFTATLTPSGATGTVQFKTNGVALGAPVTVSTGTAQISTTNLPVGTTPVTAVFAGQTGYANSTGTLSGGQVVNVPVSTPPGFPANAISVTGGTVSLTATGAIGGTFKLWATTNLALTPVTNTWSLLTNGTVTVSPFTITDPGANTNSQRFYLFSAP